MRADERKRRRRMVESAGRPYARRVTLVAKMGKVPCRVVWIGCILEIRLMARVASRVRKLEVVVDMT